MIALYIYLIQIIWYVVVFPYTKVEESFNVQAIHDHLEYFILNNNLSHYDHLLFPGVVPRSFIASLVLAFFTCPFHLLRWYLQLPKIYSLYAFRIILGFITWVSFAQFIHAIKYKFGRRCAFLTLIASILQCHVPYYSSRTLPNTYGLIFTYWAYSYWFYNQPLKCLILIGSAVILFRCDLVLLLLPMFVFMLSSREIQLLSAIKTGVFYATLILSLTIVIDSYFWHAQSPLHSNYYPSFSSPSSPASPTSQLYWLWPEGSVLYFNTIQNKSSEWGVQPWHWYFTNALPRCLNFMFPLSLLGFLGMIRYPSMKKIITMFEMKQKVLVKKEMAKRRMMNDIDRTSSNTTSTSASVVDVSIISMMLSFIHLTDFYEFYCFSFPPESTISPLSAKQQIEEASISSKTNNNDNDSDSNSNGQELHQSQQQKLPSTPSIRFSKSKLLINSDDDLTNNSNNHHNSSNRGAHIHNANQHQFNNSSSNNHNNSTIGISNNSTTSGKSSNNFLGVTSVTSASARQRVVAYYAGPTLCFLVLYSFLPHKELRFLFPALPILTWLTAVAIDQISSPLVYKVKTNTPPSRQSNNNNNNDNTRRNSFTHYNFRNSLIYTDRNIINKSYASSTMERASTTEVSIVSNMFPFDSLVYITFDIVESYLYGFDQEEIYFLLRKSIQLEGIQKKSVTMRILNSTISCLWCLTIFTSVLSAVLFSAASYSNYPGGSALYSLVHHHLLPQPHLQSTSPFSVHSNNNNGSNSNNTTTNNRSVVVNVHISPAAAMTGVSRFGQEDYVTYSSSQAAVAMKQQQQQLYVNYSKAEHLTVYDDFDWLITDDPIGSNTSVNTTFQVAEVIYGFEKFSFRFHPYQYQQLVINSCSIDNGSYNIIDIENNVCKSAFTDSNRNSSSVVTPLLPPLFLLNLLSQHYPQIAATIPLPIIYLHKKPQLYILCNVHTVFGCRDKNHSKSNSNITAAVSTSSTTTTVHTTGR